MQCGVMPVRPSCGMALVRFLRHGAAGSVQDRSGSRVSIGPLRQPGGDRRQTEPDTAAACAGVGLSCHSPPHSRYQHQIRPKFTQKAGAVKTRAAEGDGLGRKYKIRGGEGQKDGLTHDLDRRGTTLVILKG